jgi:hypothetical protein
MLDGLDGRSREEGRQHLVERLTRQIMKFDAEFRWEEAAGAICSLVRAAVCIAE